MSTRRIARIAAAGGAVLSLAAGVLTLSLAAGSGNGERGERGEQDRPAREIVLVARDMAFYLPGDGRPNPTLKLAPGELVRLTLRNEERGMVHDLASPGLDAATPQITGGVAASVELRAPEREGTYDYVCTLHPVLMRGRIEIE